VAVVSVDIQQNGNATWSVALERKYLIRCPGEFTGTALNRPLDVIGRHVLSFSGEDGGAQPRVGIRIAAAVLRSNIDFLDKAGDNLAALGVERALLVLDRGPF